MQFKTSICLYIFFKSHTTYRAEEFREKKMVSSFVLNGFSCLEKWNCNNKYKYNTELANKYRLLGFFGRNPLNFEFLFYLILRAIVTKTKIVLVWLFPPIVYCATDCWCGQIPGSLQTIRWQMAQLWTTLYMLCGML